MTVGRDCDREVAFRNRLAEKAMRLRCSSGSTLPDEFVFV